MVRIMIVALCVLPLTQKRGYNLHRSLDSHQQTLTVKSCNMGKNSSTSPKVPSEYGLHSSP